MKERPILFSAPMVRAILNGSKTQTRRVVKPRKDLGIGCELAPCELAGEVNAGDYSNARYRPGDRLWVRETCRAHELTDNEANDDTYGVIERLGLEVPPCGLDGVVYLADGVFREIENTREASDKWCALNAYRQKRGAVVPAIHMPRWASRITLEVTGVRVERLQDISEADALAEGVNVHPDHHGKPRTSIYSPVKAYLDLWESINGPGSWEANPWVWVVELKRVRP